MCIYNKYDPYVIIAKTTNIGKEWTKLVIYIYISLNKYRFNQTPSLGKDLFLYLEQLYRIYLGLQTTQKREDKNS